MSKSMPECHDWVTCKNCWAPHCGKVPCPRGCDLGPEYVGPGGVWIKDPPGTEWSRTA